MTLLNEEEEVERRLLVPLVPNRPRRSAIDDVLERSRHWRGALQYCSTGGFEIEGRGGGRGL